MGDIEIMGRLTGNAKLTCQTGDIDMILDGTVLNYDFTSQASVGDIDIEGYDDLSGGDDLFEYAEGYLQDEQIYANIKLKCDLGDISVDFQS